MTRGWVASEFLTRASKFNMPPNGAFWRGRQFFDARVTNVKILNEDRPRRPTVVSTCLVECLHEQVLCDYKSVGAAPVSSFLDAAFDGDGNNIQLNQVRPHVLTFLPQLHRVFSSVTCQVLEYLTSCDQTAVVLCFGWQSFDAKRHSNLFGEKDDAYVVV